MADGQCDFSDQAPHGRNHILTTISPPATIELCDDHQVVGLLGILAVLLGVDPEGLRGAIEKYINAQVRAAEKEMAKAQAAEQARAAADPGDQAPDTGPPPADPDYETELARQLAAEDAAATP